EKLAPAPVGHDMPGPTGESNILYVHPRGVVLCLGPDEAAAREQAELALARGNGVLVVAPGAQRIAEELGRDGAAIGGVDKRLARAQREGPIVPLVASPADADRLILERHVCIDTTASGGNAELLAGPAPAA